MPHDFQPLAQRIVDALLDADPVLASYAGDHRFDGRLPDFSPDGVMARTAMLRDAARALSEVDIERLGPEERVDQAALLAVVERGLFELTEVRAQEWDPLEHNPGPLLYALMARPFAPAAQRVKDLASRMKALPDALAVARGVLRDSPRIHLETAVRQFSGAANLIRDELPGMLAEAPELGLSVRPIAETATGALDE